MNRILCALALAIALPVTAQELDLAPLVPPKAPWLKKNQKPKKAAPSPAKKPAPVAKKSSKKKQAPTAAQVAPGAPFVATPPTEPPPLPLPLPAEAAKPAGPPKLPEPVKPVELPKPAEKPAVAQPEPLPLPPLVPLAPALSVSTLGVVVQTDDAKMRPVLQESLQSIVKIAPFTRPAPPAAAPAQPCADDACWAALAASQKLDQLLVASYQGGAMRMKLLDVAGKKSLAEADQSAVPPELAQAWAEALACKLLIPAGCMGEAAVDAGDGVQVRLDGQPLARGEKRKVAVGVHQVEARAGTAVTQQPLPVLREGTPPLFARAVAGQPRLMAKLETAPVAAIAAAPAGTATPQRAWKKPVAIAAVALGVIAGGAGIGFGAKSHSALNSAETSFHTNGGAFRAGDLSNLNDGNSAARSANTLFVISGVLLAAGAVVAFAF